LFSLESARSGFDTRHVLAVNVPVLQDGRTPSPIAGTYSEVIRRAREVPGVLNVAAGTAAR
jgi:putative ABC transport system permease protein